MATKTKDELLKAIDALSEKLGREIEVAGDATVETLTAQCKELAAELAKLEAEEEKAVEVATPKFPYYVAPGKSITSRIGIIDQLQEVKASNLPGGKVALNSLIKKKVVIKS